MLWQIRTKTRQTRLKYPVFYVTVSGARVPGGSARLGLARLRRAWRAPVWVWRRRFGQGALASSRRCFSTSSIRTPSSPLFTSLATLSPATFTPQLIFPLSRLPCEAPGPPHLGLSLGLSSLCLPCPPLQLGAAAALSARWPSHFRQLRQPEFEH